MQNVPKFDAYVKHDIANFHTHNIQKYIALFLSKPELYEDIHTLQLNDKQDYFFYAFKKFLAKFYAFKEGDFDTLNYFSSQHVDLAGAANICGGGGSRSKSGKKFFMDKYKEAQAQTKNTIVYFQKKYGISIGGKDDQRLFLGHMCPWMNASPELLNMEDWHWVKTQCYLDETLVAEFPEQLDTQLVPLSVRNKVFQLWKKKRNEIARSVQAIVVDEVSEKTEQTVVVEEDNPDVVGDKLKQLEQELANMDEDW
jgi:hypothetical protein